MQIHELEAFEAVAANRSFTRAAEALYVTQPAVTRQIASLERALKTRLFDRLGKVVQLTTAGEALHRYAAEILRLTHEAESAVCDVVAGLAGKLSVGANSTTATYLLPPLLSRFRELHPGVELAVHTGASAQVVDMVSANEVDVGVVTGYSHQEGLLDTPLTQYLTVVVVFPGHPLSLIGQSVFAGQLAGSPLILMEEGTNLRRYVDRLLSAAGVEERVTMELDNVEAIKKMIEAGLGISLLPLISVEAEVAAGRLVALPLADVPNAQRRITAIYRQDKYLTASLKSFLHLLESI